MADREESYAGNKCTGGGAPCNELKQSALVEDARVLTVREVCKPGLKH